jgi:hypothetical protein
MGGINEHSMKTLEEICEDLIKIDEVSLMEILDISSEDIVERFKDIIENKIEYFQADLEDQDDNV